jgi:hypothetical protein
MKLFIAYGVYYSCKCTKYELNCFWVKEKYIGMPEKI